jgi:hypothetical protein
MPPHNRTINRLNNQTLRAGLKLGLLICLLAAAWLLAHRPGAAAAAPTLAYTWTLSSADFQLEDGYYVSPVQRAPAPFTAAAAHLKPSGIAGFFLRVELRLGSDDGRWSPWFDVGELQAQDDGRLYGDDLVAWTQASQVQARISSPDPLPEALQDLRLVAIDAEAGPTTAQAVQAAQQQFFAAQSDPGVPQPVVVSRSAWGADESWMDWTPAYAPVDKIILHHTASGGGSDPAAEVRAIYYYHAVVRGWGDIGYNFLVDKFGNIYQGRYGGEDVIGGHAYGWNTGSLGVSVLGCYDSAACSAPQGVTQEALNAIADLSAWTASRRWLDPRAWRDFDNGSSTVSAYVLSGHKDYASTACPGDMLYAQLPDLRQAAWERLPEYDARFSTPPDTPAELQAGEQATVYLNLQNYGRLGWRDDGGVRLGYRWLQGGQVVAENNAAAHIISGAEIVFGETTALVAQLTAPDTPGDLILRWDMYREGVGWFSEQAAPAGRSQALEQSVQVLSAPVQEPSLDVRLEPTAVSAGATLVARVTVDGPGGQAFEACTQWSPELSYVAGSAQSDYGSLVVEPARICWEGLLAPGTASFALAVPGSLLTRSSCKTSTTLDVAGYPSLTVERLFVVNGLHTYLPFVGRTE